MYLTGKEICILLLLIIPEKVEAQGIASHQ